jgi:RNA polymerase sigma-70 factor (ECF subfamily)
VAYCATIDEIRRQRRRREVPVEDVAEAACSAAPDPARVAGAREIGRGIRDCLSRLLPARRRAVTLYLQGHSAPETGRILDWSLKRAENMIFRGMADMRRCLDGKGLKP